jgi:6-phosphogluconolactonase
MKKHLLSCIALLSAASICAQENSTNLIIGTYTNSCESKGIYVYDFNVQTAEVKLKATSERVINPSYFTISDDAKCIYSVNENGAKSTD